MARDWDSKRHDPKDTFLYRDALEGLFFHADLRFHEYKQFRDDGAFETRFAKWLNNVQDDRHRKALFRLACRMLFIDTLQTAALYRDAYRRIITPWLARGILTPADYVGANYDAKLRSLLKTHLIRSVTDSFDFNKFLHLNDLIDLPKPMALGEDPIAATTRVPPGMGRANGIVVLEDFVGTGTQACRVLEGLLAIAPPDFRFLFVPLIMLEYASDTFLGIESRIHIQPVLIIPQSAGVIPKPTDGEDTDTKVFRSLVNATSHRVLERFSDEDDPPKDPFGYGSSGALLVTAHNAPNNTLPLIHHRAPEWEPLFRRLHHSKDGL
jgi:hypothetical protein